MNGRDKMTFIDLIGLIAAVALVSCAGLLVASHFGMIAGVATGTTVAVTVAIGILRHGDSVTRRKRNEKEPNQASDATSEPAPGAASSSHQG